MKYVIADMVGVMFHTEWQQLDYYGQQLCRLTPLLSGEAPNHFVVASAGHHRCNEHMHAVLIEVVQEIRFLRLLNIWEKKRQISTEFNGWAEELK